MKLMFIGADHEVTGSCHYVEACGKRFLVDYGMEQGKNVYENAELPVNPSEIDFVLLTHAHIDHSGLLPLLYANGFRGSVIATKATKDLCDIMLRDSAHIQEFEAEWKNRKARRSGKPEEPPLYTMDDAVSVMEQFKGCQYNEKLEVSRGISVRFTDIGHLLGSARKCGDPVICGGKDPGASVLYPPDQRGAQGEEPWGFCRVCRQSSCSGGHQRFSGKHT